MTRKLQYFLIISFIASLLLTPFFIRVNIECRSQFGECPQELEDGIGKLEGGSLYQTRRKIASYLKNNFLVSDFSTQYQLPNSLIVNTIIKKPLFAIQDRTSGKVFLLDKEGKVLSTVESSSLPTIIQDGETPNLFALTLISGVHEMYQVGYGTITNDALVVDMPTGVRVLFPLRGEVESEILLGALRLIYAKITSDNPKVYSQIDMRYKNPVLR